MRRSLVDGAVGLQGDLVRRRRAPHRAPEAGLDLPRTRRQDVVAALPGDRRVIACDVRG